MVESEKMRERKRERRYRDRVKESEMDGKKVRQIL